MISVVPVLHQVTTRHLLDHEPRRARIGQRARCQEAEVLLGGKDILGRVGGVRRDDNLGHDLGDQPRCVRIQRLVQRHDPAKGRHPVAIIGAGIGLHASVAPRPTPQGLACLMIAQAGPSPGANSATSSNAASVSLMLL